MAGTKTNEAPGTRAVLRHHRMSAYKARQVLDLIRGQDVDRAEEMLRSTPREAARVVAKVLGSAVSNARNNDLLDPEELYVSACFADEGTTLKRWRPRARGRATRIRKRTCHITVIVSRLPDDRLERRRAHQADRSAALRSRRVAASRRAEEAVPAGASSAEVPGAPEETQEATDQLEQGGKEEETTEDPEAAEAGEVAVHDAEAGEHVQSTEESD
jgi:large subunit ribosomal protein L22